jgi:uncharacterized protein (UPF0335 family)
MMQKSFWTIGALANERRLNMTDTAVAREQLRSVVERIERLEEEKKDLATDIREVYGEAKANGYDVKVLRQIITMRKQDASERQEQEAIRDLYLEALGMQPSFNFSQAAE